MVAQRDRQPKLHNNLNVALARKRWSERDLANAVASQQPRINEIKNGRSWPMVPLAIRIARALDTTVEELWGNVVE